MHKSDPWIVVLLLFFLSCQPNPYRQGKEIFENHCGGCHGDDGSGLAHLIPPLDTSILHLDHPQKLVCLIRNGLPFDSLSKQQMPANKVISEAEMTNLVNFLGTQYIGSPQVVRAKEIHEMYSACQTSTGSK